MRIGQGYDIHKLQEGREFVLGGVKIPHAKGLLGHSDADVLVHGIIDALLGAMGERDIGTHFPDTDPRYEGADSLKLLGAVLELVYKNGYTIENIDTTVICQKPKLAPYIEKMRESLASVLKINPNMLNIKAKTNEGQDSAGREESVVAMAVVLLS